MDKRTAHHYWAQLRTLRVRYLLLVGVFFGIVAVVALRSNHLEMAKLRDAVYAADESGVGVETALEDLQAYVTSHMNTSLTSGSNGVYPPVQLKYTYSRLVQAAGEKTSASNKNIYQEAQAYCEAKIPTGFSGRTRLDCIEQYVQEHGGAPVTNIPDSLYKFDFVSPTWSPDLAGFSLLLSIAAFLTAAVVSGYRRFLKKLSS